VLRLCPEQPTDINHVAITEDATLALSTADDGLVRIWDVSSQAEMARLEPGGGRPVLVYVTEDGTAVTGAPFAGVSVWNMGTGTRLKTCSERSVESLVISRDGTMASTSTGYEGRLRVWQLDGAPDVRVGHDYSVKRVAVDPDGRFAVSTSDEELKLWDVHSGREIMSNGGKVGGFGGWRYVWLSRDATRIVAQHYDRNRVVEWCPFEFSGPRSLSVRGELVALSSDGGLVALRISPTEVGVFDRAGRSVSLMSVEPSEPVEYLHLAMCRNLDVLYQFYQSGLVIATGIQSETELARIQLAPRQRIFPWSAVASEDAVWWVDSSKDVYRWDVQSEPRLVAKSGMSSGHVIAVAGAGRSVVCGADDHTLKVWSEFGASQSLGLTLDGTIASLCISDDGTKLVAGDDSGHVYFVAVKTA
jgi:WD40 repeat protein